MLDIIADLQARGLVYQSTGEPALASWLDEEPRSLYIGFDPTADSMHVGHMMAMMNLRRFQQTGHRPIGLVGGATLRTFQRSFDAFSSIESPLLDEQSTILGPVLSGLKSY